MSQLQQQQTQVSHKSPQTQGGSYLGRSTSLPSPESVQQSADQYASRYGSTHSNRETVIKSTISTLKKSHDDVISAYSEQKSSLPKRNPYALPGEPQLIDYLKPDIKPIPGFDTEIIEFLVRRDMGEIGSQRSKTTPTEYIEWLNDANAVYDTNWVNIQKEYDEKYPVYVEAHNKWRIEYEEQQRKLAEFEAEKSRIAQRDSEIAQEKAQKNREAEYVQDFNKNWSKYYGEEAKSVADVNRITYGAKESFQAAEQRIYEQKYGDNTFSGNQQTPEQQQAAAAFEFGLIAKDAAKTTDLDHLIGLSQPLHSTYAKLAPTVQVETKQFIKDFDTNVEIAKIERQKELKVEKYQNEFRQELKGIGFTDSEIAHVEQVARDRQKPASFDDQFSRSSYERRLNEFIQKNPESREYLTGGGSTKATAQFMGEGLTSRGIAPTSREVIEVGDNTYYLTRYGAEGYEIRDEYGQIRSAGRGNVPDDVMQRDIRSLYFGNTLVPRYNPLKHVDLPKSAYEPVDVSDVVMAIQTKKLTGYDLPETDTPSGIETTPAWKGVELIHGFRTWIDETEKSILEQPNVQLVLNAVKQVDTISRSQIFTNPVKTRALGNPLEVAIQLATGKSTNEHLQPFVTNLLPKTSIPGVEGFESPDMGDRGQQYRFLRAIPIGLTVGTLEMLATMRAAGEYGFSEVKRGGLSTIPPMAVASATAVGTGMWQGYSADPAGFTGEFIGISKGMGLVTRGVGAGVLRTGQAAGVVRARTLVYQQRFGQNVPYASKSWMLTQILENEFISGARGVRRPIGREFILDENVYQPAILTRDPGVYAGEPPAGTAGFFMTIGDKYIEPVGGYFLESGTLMDKLHGGGRIYLLDDIRTVKLPESVKQRVYERVESGQDFIDIYNAEIIPRALEQQRATGEPIAVPSPKRAHYTQQPELEAFVVTDNLSPASVVTDQAFVGVSSTGTPISRIRLGSQSPIATRGILSTWRENLHYNWDVSYGMGKFYNTNYLASMGEWAMWKNLEIFERTVPGYRGEYSQHGYEHSVGVYQNLLDQYYRSSSLRSAATTEDLWMRGKYHDITKIDDFDPRVPYPHAWAAGELIRTGRFTPADVAKLPERQRASLARDIAQHTDITPEFSIKGLKTRIIDRPTVTSRALATADRMDLTRFGGTVKRSKLFKLPEETVAFKAKIAMTGVVRGDIDLPIGFRVVTVPPTPRSIALTERYLKRPQDINIKTTEYVRSGYKTRSYPTKPYPTRVYLTKPYPTRVYPTKLYPAKPYPTTVITPPITPTRVKLPKSDVKSSKKRKSEKVSIANVTNLNIRLPKAAIFGIDNKNVGNAIKPDAITKTYVNGVLKRVKRLKTK